MTAQEKKKGRGQSATVLVEALIVIPVLAIILAGVLALHAVYSAKLEAKARARRLAWLQADSGECPSSSCGTSECETAVSAVRSDVTAHVIETNSGGRSLSSFLGDLRDFFIGSLTRGVASVRAGVPTPLLHEKTVQHGRTTLLCNTTTRHVEGGNRVLDHVCTTDLRTTEYARELCR
jgi:hypothetical protein